MILEEWITKDYSDPKDYVERFLSKYGEEIGILLTKGPIGAGSNFLKNYRGYCENTGNIPDEQGFRKVFYKNFGI